MKRSDKVTLTGEQKVTSWWRWGMGEHTHTHTHTHTLTYARMYITTGCFVISHRRCLKELAFRISGNPPSPNIVKSFGSDGRMTQTVSRHRWSHGTDGLKTQTVSRYRRSKDTDGLKTQTVSRHRRSHGTDDLKTQTA